jgi:hypothetical protein
VKNIKNQKEGELTMTIFTKVRPQTIKKAISWAVHIAISLANKWWRKNEK